jgi:hypothetical protein
VQPNTFLKAFWRTAIRDEVFVAMSFESAYEPRFKKVIEPAITRILVDGNLDFLTDCMGADAPIP